VPAPPRLRVKRAEPRLDPVRWRRPGRGMLMRMGAVAALLLAGAAAAWSRPPVCAPAPAATAVPSTGPSTGAPARGRDAAAATTGSAAASPAAVPAAAGSATGGDRGAYPVPPGRIGVPVRLAEPTALALVHPGDRVDLLRFDGTGRGAGAVAVGAPVLDVTGADDPTTGGLLLALRPAEAESAVAGQGRGFAVLIRPD
jgi:hypothetical protein